MNKRRGKPKERKNSGNILIRNRQALIGVVLLLTGIIFLIYYLDINLREPGDRENKISNEKKERLPVESPIEHGTDAETGLVKDEGFNIVKGTCTTCHSSALILQNRYSREGWHEIIVWMQETQGLWDLGENEDVILDYLAANYAPKDYRGRRRPLENIEWYELEE